MLRQAGLLGLVCVLHGSICSRATAQGFNRRYDHMSPGWFQMAFAAEQLTNGNYLVIAAAPRVDSLYASSTVQATVLDQVGDTISVSRNAVLNDAAAYPGSSNSANTLPSGIIVVGGCTYSPDSIFRVALYWFDANGLAQNYVEMDLPGGWIGRQLKATPDGGFIIVGDTFDGGPEDGFILKTDSAGSPEWWEVHGLPDRREFFFSVDLAPQGGYYIGGNVGANSGTFDPWVLMCDSTGALVWEFTHGTPYEDFARAQVTSLADGTMIVGSGLPSGTFGNQWAQLFNVDSLGNIIWDKLYDVDSYSTNFSQVKEITPNGDMVACGWSYLLGDIDGILLRTDHEGDSLWMRHYLYYDSLMNDGTGLFRDVEPTADGGFIAVGAVFGSVSGNIPAGYTQDIWVVKVDSLGCIVPGCDDFSTVVAVQATNLKHALTVFPNPARERTTVNVTLPAGSAFLEYLQLRLVSSDGREVLVQKAAIGENQLSLHELAGGIYYLHLTSGTTWLCGTKLLVE
jgi:hypothetical protein